MKGWLKWRKSLATLPKKQRKYALAAGIFNTQQMTKATLLLSMTQRGTAQSTNPGET
jgi:hypothetical protein